MIELKLKLEDGATHKIFEAGEIARIDTDMSIKGRIGLIVTSDEMLARELVIFGGVAIVTCASPITLLIKNESKQPWLLKNGFTVAKGVYIDEQITTTP